MDDQAWHFDEMRAWLLQTIEALNTQIRNVAQNPPSAPARNRGEEGIAQWKEDVGRVVHTLETAKKVVLASLG